MIMHNLYMMGNRAGSQCNDLRSGTELEKRGDWDYPWQTIMDVLTFSNVFTGNIMKQGITAIKSAKAVARFSD